METPNRVSTGLAGFDQVIDGLRLGDNVVWQVDEIEDYQAMVDPYLARAKADGRQLVYVRFGRHAPLLGDDAGAVIHRVDPTQGFEGFATEVRNLVEKEGRRAFYVFDCLSDLLEDWYSDLMIGNFFRVTCPLLYELDTIAYFAIKRSVHTFATIAEIRETTQLLLDLYRVQDRLYIHPLKVWRRYSPTMFFPHLIRGDEVISITASAEVAELFSSIQRRGDRRDFWNVAFDAAAETLSLPPTEQEPTKQALMRILIGRQSRMAALCQRYFSLADIIQIASRLIGTGFIGGKSVGMLLARKILEQSEDEDFEGRLESHDSYYLGSDVFYTYIVQNGWWPLRARQRTLEGYYENAPQLREHLLHGKFPPDIRERFLQMLEYFGQAPIIVRSSSLLEDDFGNAFAGKYESVFLANQGSPEERYDAFEQAVRTVYASTMNPDALDYRMNRGLFDRDEQMAILVQRVSGDQYGTDFFPHVAGVGNSYNLYLWDHHTDAQAGMLRLVFGMGTRAVDRIAGDYARIVCLDDPLRLPPMNYGDEKKFSQRRVDLISLPENKFTSLPFEEVVSRDLKANRDLFVSVDRATSRWLREMGHRQVEESLILDFRRLLAKTDFPRVLRAMLAALSKAYDYPIDMEFTANFRPDGDFKVNVLQCRPLQTSGIGQAVESDLLPAEGEDCVFRCQGNFMGGNVRVPLDYVIHVDAREYLKLSEQNRYAVARAVGRLNTALKGKSVMLMGPGRWGTTTPSLGVPVRFTELCNMSVLCEVASKAEGFTPELSYGSHFFQDLVESGIFYVAIFDGEPQVEFNPQRILSRPNVLTSVLPTSPALESVIRVVEASDLTVLSDIVRQVVVCR